MLDTNVVLDWLIFRDARVQKLVSAIEAGAIALLTRADCRDELLRVLDYPQVQRHPQARAQALGIYDRWFEIVDLPARPAILPRCRDADDQKFLELARDAQARWLITKDRALLELAWRMQQACAVEVLDPAQASARLGPLYNAPVLAPGSPHA